MPQRITELAVGAVDGVNMSFTTSTSYRPGTLTVQLNGQTLAPSDVTAPGGVAFLLSAPPRAPGVVTVRYTAVVP